jgi:glycosyltransferase involved in cell wall biosynthesis
MDVTIIIPTYNRLWCLPRALESCRKNNKVTVQIIVVDDGSTDGTWDYLEKQTNILAIRQEKWGKPWAVNKAFSKADGKYVKFLDSDDWLVENSIDEQFELAEKNKADIVVAGYDVYVEDKLTRTQNWIECDDFIAQQLGECDSSHYSAFLFKKSFLDDIPHRTSFASANFASRDDRCFMLEVALKEPIIAISKKPTLCHFHHEKGRLQFQESMGAVGTNLQHLLIYKNILRLLSQTGRLTKRRIDASTKILWPLAHWIAKTHIKEANDVYKWILELNPSFEIPDRGAIGLLYNKLGFATTEKLLTIRRKLKFGLWN